MRGSCLCGAVRYEVTGIPTPPLTSIIADAAESPAVLHSGPN
jgi:hypothetical protein